MAAATLFDLDEPVELDTAPPKPPSCICTPGGVRCDTCHARSVAKLRMFRLAGIPGGARDVNFWDRQTSMSDWRALLCIAGGIPVDQISRTGHAPTGWEFR